MWGEGEIEPSRISTFEEAGSVGTGRGGGVKQLSSQAGVLSISQYLNSYHHRRDF